MEMLKKLVASTAAVSTVAALATVAGCGDDTGNGTTVSNDGSNGNDVTTAPPDTGAKTDASDAGGDGGLFHIDRSNLTDAGTTNPLDYSDPNLWVCRPGIDNNPCYGDHGELDTTELLPDGSQKVIKHVRATNPKFDCFYVYPTVYLTGNGNQTNLSDVSYVLDALMSQGARMSELCEVYAPLYRQVMFVPSAPPAGGDAGTAEAGSSDAGASDAGASEAGISDAGTEAGSQDATVADSGASDADASDGSILSNFAGAAAALALSDVRNAFKYYLDHFNKGRKFVLMGHSQGTGMLMSMMQTDVDVDAGTRSQMISALLIGGGASVATGQTTGGTFQNIPICTDAGSTGCMVAYSSYDITSPPGANALFGHAPSGKQTACTNPGPLNNNSGPYLESYFPTHINNALLTPSPMIMTDASTAFVLYRDAFQGNCIVDQNAYSYLQIKLLLDAGDPRPVPPYVLPSAVSIGFGLHTVDWHLPMRDLIDIVKAQATAEGVGP
jgi:hypothetical protein